MRPPGSWCEQPELPKAWCERPAQPAPACELPPSSLLKAVDLLLKVTKR
ncbi:hypothetical protein [Nonomuraea sp. NPDC046570]